MNKTKVQKQFKFNYKIQGFSLIELIIVLLVISIIAVAAFPQIQQTLRLYRVESAAGLLSNRLTEARLTAIKHNRPAWLEINTIEKTLEVWTTNQNNEPIRANLAVPISEDVSVISGSPLRVTFNSLGRNQANSNVAIKLKLSKTNFCKAVSVSVAGSITTAPC